MILSATFIRRSQRVRVCDTCHGYIYAGESAIRMTGMAFRGDPVSTSYSHPACHPLPVDLHAEAGAHKLEAALDAWVDSAWVDSKTNVLGDSPAEE